MKLLDYLIQEYGYNEPIFSNTLVKELKNVKPNTIRQSLKRLVEKNQIRRYQDGIYFIPDPNSNSKYKTLSPDSIINKKYLVNKNNKRVGYISGLSLANSLKLTTQVPAKTEVVSNMEKSSVRTIDLKNRKVIVRKPRTTINDDNFKLLQMLDLITNFDNLNIKKTVKAINSIADYLKDVDITKDQLNACLKNYPNKTYKTLIESNLYEKIISGRNTDEITR